LNVLRLSLDGGRPGRGCYTSKRMGNHSLVFVQRGLSTRLLLFGLERLLPIAPYHDDRQEAANNRSAQNYENDRDANGPDARWKERVKGVVLVNEGL
jgi:hypothetical protein